MRSTPRALAALRCLLLLVTLAFTSVARGHAPATDMARAAQAWLDTLSPEQRSRALFPLTDKERENWYYVPLARAGLRLDAMTDAQRSLTHDLLKTGLSQRGHARAEAIIALENALRELENGAARRNPAHYYLTLFGTPADAATWGWRFEGHHLSLNFTVIDGQHVMVTPSFFGANPAEVPRGPQKGLRTLPDEEDLGRAFMLSLDEKQRATALLTATAPFEIETSNRPRIDPLAPAGLAASALTPAQNDALRTLLRCYLDRYRPELADAAFARIEAAGWGNVRFAWAGSVEPHQPHYYRLQGPTFVVEYDDVQNGANHIHTVWRDYAGDFGRDLLAEHRAAEHSAKR